MNVAVVDYGAGNIGSVVNALRYLGVGVKLGSNRNDLLSSDAIILPGVGAFRSASEDLKATGLPSVLRLMIVLLISQAARSMNPNMAMTWMVADR